MQEALPQLTYRDNAIIGANDVIAYLNDMQAFDVSSNAELQIAKKKRSTAQKFAKQAKDARKEAINQFKEFLSTNYPEIDSIEELANDVVTEFDSEIKPYLAEVKGERLKKAQSLIDEVSNNYEQTPFKAPSELSNEEYWTAKGNPSNKLEKRVVALVLEEKYRIEQESRVEQIHTAKSNDFKSDIQSVIDGVDELLIYSGEDVLKLLEPLKKYL